MNRRLINGSAFLFIMLILFFALYLQYIKGEDPCSLCIFQRVAYIGLAILFLLDLLQNPKSWGIWVYEVLKSLTALTGGLIAGRQVWLQHLPPDQIPTCGPGLSYILSTHTLPQTLTIVLKGSGDCATVGWTFLGFSIAQWSLTLFILVILLSVFNYSNRR